MSDLQSLSLQMAGYCQSMGPSLSQLEYLPMPLLYRSWKATRSSLINSGQYSVHSLCGSPFRTIQLKGLPSSFSGPYYLSVCLPVLLWAGRGFPDGFAISLSVLHLGWLIQITVPPIASPGCSACTTETRLGNTGRNQHMTARVVILAKGFTFIH